MNQVSDLLEAIKEKLLSYARRTGATPAEVSISPGSYRQLVELRAWEGRIGNLVIGCSPATHLETPLGKIRVVIDEMLSDAVIEIA
jgi:hypothetical protein